jgi:ABC-type nitrate/sulfonate/bicarbonate transport system substrate-binding protein
MSAADQGQSGNAPLRIGGGAGGFNWLPVIAADREGMFARRNLAIEVKRLGAVDKATAAVKSGDASAAAISGSSPATSIGCHCRSSPIRAFAGSRICAARDWARHR